MIKLEMIRTSKKTDSEDVLLGEFLLALKVNENRSPHTISNYGADLRQFQVFLASKSLETALPTITRRDILKFFDQIYERGLTPASRNRKIAALQKFFSWATSNGYISKSPMESFPRPKIPHRAPRYLREQEFRNFAQKPLELGNSFRGLRDRALISILLGTGIRLSECVGLNTEDVSVREREMRVIRKGNREQRLPLSHGTCYHLGQYLKARYLFLNGKKDGPLFVSQKKRRISQRAVQTRLKIYAELCGIEHVHPHALRHTFATFCLDSGVDLIAVREFLGHKSVRTTERYLHITPDYLKKILEKVQLF